MARPDRPVIGPSWDRFPSVQQDEYDARKRDSKYQRDLRRYERELRAYHRDFVLGKISAGTLARAVSETSAAMAANGIDPEAAKASALGSLAGGALRAREEDRLAEALNGLTPPEEHVRRAMKEDEAARNKSFMDKRRQLTGPLETMPQFSGPIGPWGEMETPGNFATRQKSAFPELDVSYTPSGKGAGKSRGKGLSRREVADLEAYTREAATKRGIDPNTAVRVARSEGLQAGTWQSKVVKGGIREDSFGPFQLKETNGLGALFEKQTGLNVRDKRSVKAQIDFALDYAAQHGWGSWYGAARTGVGKWTGLKNAQPVGVNTQVAENVPTPQARPDTPIAGLFAQEPEQQQPSTLAGLFGITPAAASEMPTAPQAAPSSAQDALSQWAAGQDFASKQRAAQQDYNAKRETAANSAPAMSTPKADRFGGLMAEPSPDRFASPETTQDMALAHLMSEQPSFDQGLNPQFSTAAPSADAFQSPSPTINKMMDGMMNPVGPAVDTAVAPDPQAEQEAMAALQGPEVAQTAFAEEPAPAPAVAAANSAVAAPAPAAQIAAYDPAKGLGLPGNISISFDDFDAARKGLNKYATQPTIAEDESQQTIGFPQAPQEPDDGLFGPKAKAAVAGLLLGGPLGAAAGGLFGDKLGSLGKLGGLFDGPAGPASAGERFDAGFGTRGIEQGMYGPRGATGYSVSSPGAFTVSRGPNQGYDLTNSMGVTTPYDAQGHIMANSDTMKAWGNVLGGLFGRDEDKDKNRGGPVGGYSGNGLY